MKIVLASHNQKKIAELRTLLGEYIPDVEVLSLADAGVEGEIVEDGDTFEANALIKARAAAASGYIGVGDDSGLCVEALDGAPGVYSARYAGEQGDDEANLDLVLENMKGKSDRRAAFVCCIACAFPDGSDPIVCHGRVDGELLEAREGKGGFGYDPIFYYPPFGTTFGVASAEQKNTVSHRARALAAFAKALGERLTQEK
ncbi:MAG: RdgB/HAM1 family non-canonical purine NTP pyrophosphatase [Ruminococcaceae bacterium]|nr:RdgB/HAM1 family non-canonical purine NTP pyrophosphatase [Oscillospiraceae bacterium]